MFLNGGIKTIYYQLYKKKFKKKLYLDHQPLLKIQKVISGWTFESVLNINVNNIKEITKSIERIIQSYKKKIKKVSNQQILV